MLRVVTYNIHHGADPRGTDTLPAVAEVLRGARGDVVCLQEVDRAFGPRSGFVDQLSALAEALDMHGHFAATLRRRGGSYGNAILTSAPPRDGAEWPLPVGAGEEPRALASATVSTRFGDVTVFSAHLTPGRHGRATRHRQLRRIRDLVRRAGRPVVLAGDLNTGSRAELAVLGEVLRHATPPGGGRLARCRTRTFPAWFPVLRLDHVFADHRFTVDSLRVHASTASDHRPLAVDLTLGTG